MGIKQAWNGSLPACSGLQVSMGCSAFASALTSEPRMSHLIGVDRNDQCASFDTARHKPLVWSLDIWFKWVLLVCPFARLEMHPQMMLASYSH